MTSKTKEARSESRRTFIAKSAAAAAMIAYPDSPSNTETIQETGTETLPDECVRPDRLWQYKRLVKEQISRLHDGDIDRAIHCLHELAKLHPTDPEFYYALCIAHCLKGELDVATNFAQRATDNGLPFNRFLAGPRTLLENLYVHPPFAELAIKEGTALIHGPMLGCVSDTEAKIWLRTRETSEVLVKVIDGASQTDVSQGKSTTSRGSDFTTVVHLSGLEANSTYSYQLYIDGALIPQAHTFRTFPRTGSPAKFEIGFGGCAGYTPWQEYMWRTIANYQFPLFLLTGDNVYIDDPTRISVNQYCYYRRQSRPEFRELVAGSSIAAIWDDHDFSTNDSWGGPSASEPDWKTHVWNTFKQNWNNPSYGGGPNNPGCWFSLSIGDVDLFMLDGRYYRTNHKNPPPDQQPTMLGPVQKKWLLNTLRASKATFKLLVTSVPWAYGVKPGSTDPWQGFKDEREEIFSFIEDQRINGVFLLSGDRHRADIWKIERENGYDLYDFENGRLTNLHTHDILPGAIYGYNEKCTFGRLRFDTTLDDPQVIYDIITIDDEVVCSFPLSLSSITHQ